MQQTEEFIRLFTKCEPRIFAYIVTLLHNLSDAEDVLQQTGLIMWRKFDEFESGTDFLSWARQIARFEVLALRKRKQRAAVQFSDEFVEAVASETEIRSEMLETRHRALLDCLTKLKAPDRELVQLRYEPDATTHSVSVRVGRSVDAVYKALNRIRQSLFECINRALAMEARL